MAVPSILLLCIIFLSGCWDQMNIEQRGFVLGVAIDAYPPAPAKEEGKKPGETPPEEEMELEIMETHTGKPLYALTVQLPILRKSSQPSEGGTSGGGGQDSNTWDITQIGNSIYSMNRELLSRTSLALYYEHLQVIVLSDRIARQGIADVLDFFTRDPEMRRRVRVFISKGEAKSVLDVTPRVEEYASMYLSKMPINATRNSRMVHQTDLGEIIIAMHNDFSFILPVAQSTKDEIKISGAAAIKGDKMVGWVSELETEAVKMIQNRYLGGVVTVSSPEKEGAIEVLEVTKAKTKITPLIKNDEITMRIKIMAAGNYAEHVQKGVQNTRVDTLIARLQQEFEKEIAKNCAATIEIFQSEYKTDVFQFCQILQAEEPAYWEKISGDWEDHVFPGMNVEIEVDVTINLTGSTR
jgi:Ger(x)C family germination protein